MKSFPFYRATGTHRELGRAHGQQAREQIQTHLNYLCETSKLSVQRLRDRAMRFNKLFEEHCPHLIEELQGLAEGAGVTYAESLALNARSALTNVPDGGCTAFVVSRYGTECKQILIGQNSDQLPVARDLGYVLHLKPQDKPEVLMWTFGGMIGYHGINSLGIGHFANDLGGGPVARFGMPHYPLKRMMHECASLTELTQIMERIPLWANGNYVLCDGHGEILDIEATPDRLHLLRDNGAGFICHANHFLCPLHANQENFDVSAKDSFPRLSRMNALIQARYGQLTVDDCKTILRDRHGDPNGICRIAQTDSPQADWRTAGMTVASIIAEPDRRCLHVACGNQAETPFEVYSMN